MVRAFGASPAVMAVVGMLVLGAFSPVASAPVLVVAQGRGIDCASSSAPTAFPFDATPDSEVASPEAEAVSFPTDGGEVTVFAAASLTDAFEAMGERLEAEHDGLRVSFNFAGSQVLVTQLAEGAEADVFASANGEQMAVAIEQGAVSSGARPFARNRLAIVVPSDNPADVLSPSGLGDEGVKVVLAQPEVPAGRYARESLCSMGQDREAFGDRFVERVSDNVVSEDEDVRDVLTRIRLGEADAGIVYLSDAVSAGDEVRVIDIPEDVNVVAAYPIAAVEGGDTGLADAFIDYVLGPDGQATLIEYGFRPAAG